MWQLLCYEQLSDVLAFSHCGKPNLLLKFDIQVDMYLFSD